MLSQQRIDQCGPWERLTVDHGDGYLIAARLEDHARALQNPNHTEPVVQVEEPKE